MGCEWPMLRHVAFSQSAFSLQGSASCGLLTFGCRCIIMHLRILSDVNGFGVDLKGSWDIGAPHGQAPLPFPFLLPPHPNIVVRSFSYGKVVV